MKETIKKLTVYTFVKDAALNRRIGGEENGVGARAGAGAGAGLE
jgi:hypothetical protein